MTNQNSQPRVALPGSERQPIVGAQVTGPVDPNERFEVSVYLRAPAGSDLAQDIQDRVVNQQQPLSREEYAARYSASSDDIARVERFALAHNLIVIEANAVRRVVVLSGSAQAVGAAFGTQIQRYTQQQQTYRGRTGPLTVPADIAPLITGVLGIDNRPQARAHIHYAEVANIVYTPPQLSTLYNFPTTGNGAGQTIAI
ncbi:MAG TPA: protease pro-enzyme activation domain-containing protein, partial [Ktedonobacteraceae bacterium]|nr:protease pro-enzyme activation domain-containing protein [Ktedonobacteraceae bacterium]